MAKSTNSLRVNRRHLTLFIPAVLFFLSGCASLIFEVLCARKLALVLGSTVSSSSATVASFLLGLGIGSYLVGRYVRKKSHLIRLFAMLEAGAGLACLVALWVVDQLPIWLAGHSSGFILKLGIAFLVFLPPAVMMGASLPVLCQHYSEHLGGRFLSVLANLYAINTLGAVVGVLSTDFYLVVALGMKKSGFVAAGLYFLVAVLASLSVSLGGGDDESYTPQSYGDFKASPRVAIATLVGTGFCGLTYQILWTRALSFYVGNVIFLFSTILAVYLGGIVLGSLGISLFGHRIKQPRVFLGVVVGLLSLAAYWGLFAASVVHPAMNFLISMKLREPWITLAASCIIMGPASLLLGLLFPLASRMMLDSNHESGETVGKAYLANSVGSAFGAFSAGLILIPLLGLHWSLIFASSVTMLLSLMLLGPLKESRLMAGVLVALFAATLFVTRGDTLLRILYEEKYPHIVYQADDYYGSVAFTREWSEQRQEHVETLYVNNFDMAGNSIAAKQYTTNLSSLAILLHPKPENVLIVCMGLGNTTRTALEMKETVQVDCVELSRKVLSALALTSHGEKVLQNPKLNLIVGDGRNHLLSTSKKYDVISAEPPPPLHAGVVNLYSKEYYELCKKRLRPNGIVVQWLPVFQMSEFEAQVIISAFKDVFPHVSLWQGERLQLILLGSNEPMSLDFESLKARVANNRELLSENSLDDPYKIESLYLANTEDLRKYTEDVPPLTDDWPRIQYSDALHSVASKFFFFRGFESDFQAEPADRERLKKARKAMTSGRYFLLATELPTQLSALARLELGRKYLAAFPDDIYFLNMSLSSDKHLAYAREQLAKNPTGNPRLLTNLAELHYLRSSYEESIEAAQKAGKLDPGAKWPVFLQILALHRGAAEGLVPDGEARARKIYEGLDKNGLAARDANELKFLDWLFEEDGSGSAG